MTLNLGKRSVRVVCELVVVRHFAVYLFCMRNSGQGFQGTWNNTNVAIKVLATASESGVTPSLTVCRSYHFSDSLLMSRV